jgi:hypothetical protein
MARYAFIRNSDDSVVNKVDYDSFNAGEVAHKFGSEHEYRIVPINRLADPAYDPETQRLGALQETVFPNELQLVREVVAIPQIEIDNAVELAAIKAAALDLKNGVGTAEERLTRCERVLFRMLQDQYGN